MRSFKWLIGAHFWWWFISFLKQSSIVLPLTFFYHCLCKWKKNIIISTISISLSHCHCIYLRQFAIVVYVSQHILDNLQWLLCISICLCPNRTLPSIPSFPFQIDRIYCTADDWSGSQLNLLMVIWKMVTKPWCLLLVEKKKMERKKTYLKFRYWMNAINNMHTVDSAIHTTDDCDVTKNKLKWTFNSYLVYIFRVCFSLEQFAEMWKLNWLLKSNEIYLKIEFSFFRFSDFIWSKIYFFFIRAICFSWWQFDNRWQFEKRKINSISKCVLQIICFVCFDNADFIIKIKLCIDKRRFVKSFKSKKKKDSH